MYRERVKYWTSKSISSYLFLLKSGDFRHFIKLVDLIKPVYQYYVVFIVSVSVKELPLKIDIKRAIQGPITTNRECMIS